MFASVSIIVPIYNSDKYLKACLESLVNQTLKNIEIILVDDNSQDDSKIIISEYAKKDDRITVIYNKKNQGPSKARNDALKIATGEFIGFVDSDDYIAEDMYETMYNAAQKTNAEIVTCGYEEFDYREIISNNPSPFNSGVYINHEEMVEVIEKAHADRFIWFSWRNIYKREMLLDNNILFDEDIKHGEDNIFNLYAFYHAEGVISLNKSLYFYRKNPTSLTGSKIKPYLTESIQNEYDRKIEFYHKYGLYDKCKEDLMLYVSTHLLTIMLANENFSNGNFKKILSIHMVKESLDHTPYLVKNSRLGVKVVVLLAKLKQVKLLNILYKLKHRV